MLFGRVPKGESVVTNPGQDVIQTVDSFTRTLTLEDDVQVNVEDVILPGNVMLH